MTDKYVPITPSLIGAFLLGATCSAISIAILFIGMPLVGWVNDAPVPVSLVTALHMLWESERAAFLGLPIPAAIDALGVATGLAWRADALMAATVAAVMVAALYLLMTARQVSASVRHVAGRRILDGDEAVEAAARHEANSIVRCGQGLWLAPDVMMSRERETLQIAVIGSIGGGKTQVFLHFIEQIIERGDKAIVHDTKGDFVAGWPNEDYILISPTDERTWSWHVARDVSNVQRARELAARLVPKSDSGQQMWSQGSRAFPYPAKTGWAGASWYLRLRDEPLSI